MLIDKPRMFKMTEYDFNGDVLAQVMDEYQRTKVDPIFGRLKPSPAAFRLVVKIVAKWLRVANHLGGEKEAK